MMYFGVDWASFSSDQVSLKRNGLCLNLDFFFQILKKQDNIINYKRGKKKKKKRKERKERRIIYGLISIWL